MYNCSLNTSSITTRNHFPHVVYLVHFTPCDIFSIAFFLRNPSVNANNHFITTEVFNKHKPETEPQNCFKDKTLNDCKHATTLNTAHMFRAPLETQSVNPHKSLFSRDERAHGLVCVTVIVITAGGSFYFEVIWSLLPWSHLKRLLLSHVIRGWYFVLKSESAFISKSQLESNKLKLCVCVCGPTTWVQHVCGSLIFFLMLNTVWL